MAPTMPWAQLHQVAPTPAQQCLPVITPLTKLGAPRNGVCPCAPQRCVQGLHSFFFLKNKIIEEELTYNVSGAQLGKQSFNLALGSFLLMSFSGSLNPASGGLLMRFMIFFGVKNTVIFLLLGVSVLEASQVALVVKNLPAKAGDMRDVSLIPGSGRSPGGGHGNPLQYSCLENPMDRGVWKAIVHRVPKSQT